MRPPTTSSDTALRGVMALIVTDRRARDGTWCRLAAMTRQPWLGLAALLIACTACAGQPPDGAHAPHAAAEAKPPVLYDNLGSHSYRITTVSPGTQRWFDQGLRLVYAFNHHEAQRAFREAARLDPRCAMCFWGIAIT